MDNQASEIKTEITKDRVVGPPVGGETREAYERRLDEIRAVPEEALTQIGVDVPTAVQTVLGSLPSIRKHREAMSALPDLNAKLVDGLEEYAWATSEAHGLLETASAPVEDLAPLLDAAMKMRETFRLDAISLVHRGLVDPARVASLKGLVGFKNVANELMEWALVMRQSWSRIEGKSALTGAEIDAASALGLRLTTLAGLREQQPALIAEAAHIRHQALTLLMASYDEIRRALVYLRWKQDDVETIAPSLFVRNGRRNPAPPAPAPTNGSAPVVQPTPPVVTPPAGATPGAVHAAAPTPPPGMPGAKLLIDE